MATTKVAIVVEDTPEDQDRIGATLRSAGFEVLAASDSSEALAWLAASPHPDLIVLDWYCEGPAAGDGPAQAIIKDVLNSCFAPVAVITLDAVRAEQNIPPEMPPAFYAVFSKFELDDVLSKLGVWASKKEFLIARRILSSGTSSLVKVAWELARYQEAGINSWLACVDDAYDFLEMLLRFSRREIERDPTLFEELDNEIGKMKAGAPDVTPLLLRVLSADRYFMPHQKALPMSGDIHHTPDGSFAILVNPACDLLEGPKRQRKAARAGLLSSPSVSTFEPAVHKSGQSLKNRILSRLRNQDPSGAGQVRTYGLPLVPIGRPNPYSEFVDLVVDFDKPIVLDWDEFQAQLPPTSRVARLDVPYIDALMRQYSHFTNRMGLREISDKVLEDRARTDAG